MKSTKIQWYDSTVNPVMVVIGTSGPKISASASYRGRFVRWEVPDE